MVDVRRFKKINMKCLCRNHRKTYRRTSRQKESPHDDSQLSLMIINQHIILALKRRNFSWSLITGWNFLYVMSGIHFISEQEDVISIR